MKRGINREWRKTPPKVRKIITHSLPFSLTVAVAIPSIIILIIELIFPLSSYKNWISSIFLIIYIVTLYFIARKKYNNKTREDINEKIHKEMYGTTPKTLGIKESLYLLRYFLIFWSLGAICYYFKNKSDWFILLIALCFFLPIILTIISQRNNR